MFGISQDSPAQILKKQIEDNVSNYPEYKRYNHGSNNCTHLELLWDLTWEFLQCISHKKGQTIDTFILTSFVAM